MSATSVYLMIIGISFVSLLPRILPIAILSRFEFPEALKKWLSFIAPAVLGALTALSIFAPQGGIDFSSKNLYLWAFIPTFLVAVKSKSLFFTLFTGILSMALLYNCFMS